MHSDIEADKSPSTPVCSSQKKYVPTPKISERKRALFSANNRHNSNIIIEEESDKCNVEIQSDNSLDGLEFHDKLYNASPIKNNLLKNSSFLSNIEETNNDDLLLSVDNSNDFEIPIQSPIKNKDVPRSFQDVLKNSILTNLNSPKTPAENSATVSKPPNITFTNFKKHNSNDSIDSNLIIPETPPRKSTPKTPYETSNIDLELPRINNNRKSLLTLFQSYENVSLDNLSDKYIKENVDRNCINNKRKLDSPYSELSFKNTKLDEKEKKNSKARTSLLFPSDEENVNVNKTENEYKMINCELSPKNFYRPSLSPPKKSSLLDSSLSVTDRKLRSQNRIKYSTRKSVKKRHSFGEINGGVRTGIKKPKIKSKLNRSLSKNQLFKEEALKLLQESSTWKNKVGKNQLKNLQSLPTNKVIEMDNLMQQIKNPTTIVSNLKRPSDNDNDNEDVQQSKIQKLDENIQNNNKENVPLKPRKFFKSKTTLTENKTVNMFKNFTLKMENGKLKVMNKSNIKSKVNHNKDNDYKLFKMDTKTEENLIEHEITSVINKLEDDVSKSESTVNQITISAHFTNIKDDNSIILHQPPQESEMSDLSKQENNIKLTKYATPLNADDIIMSPTSLMCDMTSGLALSSPKKLTITKAANLIEQLSNCPTKSELQAQQKNQKEKVFPVFIKGRTASAQALACAMNNNKMTTRSRRIWKTLDEKQYQIDAGQKRWGYTQCPQCELVYSQNEPEEEQRHFDFHNNVHYLKFNGWKNERVVSMFDNVTRIIEILPSDSKLWWKKIIDLLTVVDRDLGYAQNGVIDVNCSKAYLYIKNKQILGFLLAVPIKEAHRMLSNQTVDCCSEKIIPVKCGISRLWVANGYRRQKIGTYLIDSFRKQYIPGYNLTINDFAFSVPTQDGKIFAQNYSKTNEILIYVKDN